MVARLAESVLSVLGLLTVTLGVASAARRRQNILFILGDDLGWADFQRHDPSMRTPNLDRLAQMGMFLENSYVMETGVPTRVALMTGRYPHNFGLQHKNRIKGTKPTWLNETATLLPEVLKTFNYSTHLVGQWGLGFCNWALTPTARGFDTHYGMLLGASASYYNHSDYKRERPATYDFWDNREIDWSAKNQYSTELLTARARQIIQDSSTDVPWFLFLTYQAAHKPYEVPGKYVTQYCSHVTDRNRQIHCAMVAAMDEGIGHLLDDLETKGITNNTIVLFMSDNGGPAKEGYSSNYPLRGGKEGLWEGGVKSYTVFSIPGMLYPNSVYTGLFHAVDVYPTLCKAAGKRGFRKSNKLDGNNMFGRLKRNRNSPRKFMLYNVNDRKSYGGIRRGNWKLLMGRPGKRHGWYPTADQQANGAVFQHIKKTAYNESDWHLFDLDQDPGERNNVYQQVSDTNQVVIRKLKSKLTKYWEEMVPSVRSKRSQLGRRMREEAGHWTPGFCDI